MDLCCSVHVHWSGDLRGTEAGESSLSSLRRWPCHWCQGKASSWPWVAALSLLKERLGPDEGYLWYIYQLRHTSPHIVWLFRFFIIDMFLSIMFNHVQLLYITYIYISCIVLYRLKSRYVYIYIYVCDRSGATFRFPSHILRPPGCHRQGRKATDRTAVLHAGAGSSPSQCWTSLGR